MLPERQMQMWPLVRVFLVACIICVIAAHDARSDMSVEQYRKNMSEQGYQIYFTIISLRGFVKGLEWANAELMQDKKTKPFFCPPPSMAITDEQVIDILDKYLESHRINAKAPVEGYLLMAVENAFPCRP
jgi:hypothetical protein